MIECCCLVMFLLHMSHMYFCCLRVKGPGLVSMSPDRSRVHLAQETGDAGRAAGKTMIGLPLGSGDGCVQRRDWSHVAA